MMQTANFHEGDDHAHGRRADLTGFRAILIERQMRSGAMIVSEMGQQDAAQVGLVENDDVIEGGQQRDHAHDAMARVLKPPGVLALWSFEQAQPALYAYCGQARRDPYEHVATCRQSLHSILTL